MCHSRAHAPPPPPCTLHRASRRGSSSLTIRGVINRKHTGRNPMKIILVVRSLMHKVFLWHERSYNCRWSPSHSPTVASVVLHPFRLVPTLLPERTIARTSVSRVIIIATMTHLISQFIIESEFQNISASDSCSFFLKTIY